MRGEHVNGAAEVGDRVAYEDMANPYQVGTVTEVLSPSCYRVIFEAVESDFGPEFGLPARETLSDLRQCGWRFAEPWEVLLASSEPSASESFDPPEESLWAHEMVG